MIIFRYLSREVLSATTAVTAVLLLVITSARLIKYLAEAASGRLDADVVFKIMFFRIPGFLELLLPLGLFLGILLSFGRLYLESEMVVLRACGVSHKRLVGYALGPALLVAFIVGLMSLKLSPEGIEMMTRIVDQQASRSQLELLTPGRFQTQDNGKQATYAGALNAEGTGLENVFIVQRDDQDRAVLLTAKSAHQATIEGQGRFLILDNGHRYDGVPGNPEYKETNFGEYGVRLPDPTDSFAITEVEAKSTSELWQLNDPEARAALHWRFSLPILAFIVTLIAVPLSRTNPRQGRYAKLIPAIICYLLYVALLTSARSGIEDAKIHPWVLWSIHGVFLVLAANLIFADRFWSGFFHRIPSLRKSRRGTQS